MIDDERQELAADYVLNALDPYAAGSFEAQLASDPELRAFTDELCEAAAGLAQAVDRLVAQDHHGPGERAAPRRVVGPGTPPDVGKAFLEHVFGFLFIVRHLEHEGIQARRKAIVKRPKRRLLAGGNAREQLDVELTVGFFGGGHGRANGNSGGNARAPHHRDRFTGAGECGVPRRLASGEHMD